MHVDGEHGAHFRPGRLLNGAIQVALIVAFDAADPRANRRPVEVTRLVAPPTRELLAIGRRKVRRVDVVDALAKRHRNIDGGAGAEIEQ